MRTGPINCLEIGYVNQWPLITDGRNRNEMLRMFPNYHYEFYLGISKVTKISLSNLNDKDFRSYELIEKKMVGVAILLSHPHEHGRFWLLFIIQRYKG